MNNALGNKLAEGNTSELFAWEPGQVVKLYKAHYPETAVQAEYAKIQAITASGIDTPHAHGLVEINGRFGIIMNRVKGTDWLTILQKRPYLAPIVGRIMAELHATLHQTTASQKLSPNRQRILERLERNANFPEKEKAKLKQLVKTLPEGDALCHGDFHPGNILHTPNGPVVIDWVDATRGHPFSDIARTLVIFKGLVLPTAVQRLLFGFVIKWMLRAYVKRYTELRPYSQQEVDAWMVPVTAVRLDEGLSPAETEKLRQFLLHQLA